MLPVSAKSKIDNQVLRKQLEQAQQIIQAQDQKLRSLQHRIAIDAKPKKDRVLRPVHPSFALEIEYRRKLECLIDDMQKSVVYWLKAAFKANEPEVTALAQDAQSKYYIELVAHYWRIMKDRKIVATRSNYREAEKERDRLNATLAQDALPAIELRRAIRKLSRRWQKGFNEASLDLAKWFSLKVHQRSTKQLQSILKKGGWTVEMQMTKAQRDILAASIQENVSLIKSIPSQYFTQIEGMVMRSVQTGRDLHQLTTDLQRQFHTTRKRAELISRDQSNKITANITRARQLELGITTAIWVHSGAGKHPRPTHVRQNGKPYDIVKGWWDPAVKKYIFPGTEVNCRCVSRSVVAGFS
jgi:SPP1 gp7 family putative phage head morphogenesis protein